MISFETCHQKVVQNGRPSTSANLTPTASSATWLISAGTFMYDDDRGTRLVMLIRPMAVEKTTPMSPYQSGGTSGFAWAQNGIGYSLVGRARPEILHPLADEVRRQIART